MSCFQLCWSLYLFIFSSLPWLCLPLSFEPPYCSHGDLRVDRAIPELAPEDAAKVSHLKQLIVLIRHGSRTPYTKLTCWKGYDTVWNDCGVTEMVVPSDSYTAPMDLPLSKWLFRKVFDGSPTWLGGNCQTGQLIEEGYRQELQLGQALKVKFIGSDDSSKGDFKLFQTDDYVQAVDPDRVYFRSDNMERTFLSAQTLLSGMFPSTSSNSNEVIIDWHTGDYALDQIYPNAKVCPALTSIKEAAVANNRYAEVSASSESLENTLDFALGGAEEWNWSEILDCFMTTVCSGRGELPVDIDDQIFNLTVHHVEESFARISLFNNSYWSKVAMQNLTSGIRKEIVKSIENDETALKFMLYGAHDTTLMPFLAAILGENWDRKWAPYASMVTIEVYAAGATEVEDYFRVVYNGIPQIVPSCGDKILCEVKHLLDTMNFGVTECPSVDDFMISSQEDDIGISFDGKDYPIILFLTLLLGILIGATLMRSQLENQKLQRENFQALSDHSSHDSFTSSSSSSSSVHYERRNRFTNRQRDNDDSGEDEIYINTAACSMPRASMKFNGEYESEMVDFRI